MNASSTIEYYNQHAAELLSKYNSFNTEFLHQLILETFGKSSAILEFGIGSGRDLNFLIENGYSAFGIEGSESFINSAITNFPELQNRIFHLLMPDVLPSQLNKLDGFLASAFFIHFDQEDIRMIFKELNYHLKDGATGIISISINREKSAGDSRYFNNLSLPEWENLFLSCGYSIRNRYNSEDQLKRKIDWYTYVITLK